jgi:glycosyltransferase involved in cell wall biosynthesis
MQPTTGSGYVVNGFVTALKDEGNSVDVWEPDDYILHIPIGNRATDYRNAIGALLLIRSLDLSQYRILIFWGSTNYLAIKWLAEIKGARPLVIHQSNGPECRYLELESSRRWPGFRHRAWIERSKQAFRLADGVLAVSDWDRDWLVDQGIADQKRTFTIEPGIENCFCVGTRSTAVGQSLKLIFCGTWLKKKGIDRLTADVPKLLRQWQNCTLTLVGVGDAWQISEWFPADVSDRIQCIAFIKEKMTLADVFRDHDILLLPSMYESFGLVAAEAMACGCAVAMTKTGWGASLLVDEYIQITDERDSLYLGIGHILNRPELLNTISAKGTERAKKLRWQLARKTLWTTLLHLEKIR